MQALKQAGLIDPVPVRRVMDAEATENRRASSTQAAVKGGGAAQAAVAGQDIYVLLDETYANLAAMETGLETGDHELTVNAGVSAEDSFFVVWSDGTDAHVSNVRIDNDTPDFVAGDLVATDFAIITGTGTLTTGELHADNFVII